MSGFVNMSPGDIWAYIQNIEGSTPGGDNSGATNPLTNNPLFNPSTTPNPSAINTTGNIPAGVAGITQEAANQAKAAGSNPNGFMQDLTQAQAPPSWMAANALAAYKSGNTKYRDHLLADPTIANNPHLKNFIIGLFNGDPDRIAEAQHYSTVFGVPGVDYPVGAGDGIPGDGR